ncbi:ribokinase [Kitasatospora sp. NPDC058170]|uniref:ribokinase n=1 Tax=Kitasatospora sp. NPDC058170 TaxID=3346364 RepID=UPI0036DEBE71
MNPPSPSDPGRVVAIGSVNTDRILRCPVLPAPGETVLAVSATQGFGGKGANQAVAAATMGAPTHLVAKVGADTDGVEALADLRSARVDVSTVLTDPAAPTGQAIVMVDPNGENSIVVIPGANACLDPAEVTEALARLRLTPADVLLTSGEVPPDCVRAAAEALPAGTRWVHNAAPAGVLPTLVGRRPLIVANTIEAGQLTGATAASAPLDAADVIDTPDAPDTPDTTRTPDPSKTSNTSNPSDPTDSANTAAEALAALGDGAVITLGSEGALVAEGGRGGRTSRVPAPRVTVVDTTGAGDVFCGALAAELARGAALTEAVATAVAAGAFAVTALGARGALPTPAEVRRLRTP